MKWKIEFNPVKVILQIVSQIVWYLPFIIVVEIVIEEVVGLPRYGWMWWIIMIVSWRWFDWGFRLRKFADDYGKGENEK